MEEIQGTLGRGHCPVSGQMNDGDKGEEGQQGQSKGA